MNGRPSSRAEARPDDAHDPEVLRALGERFGDADYSGLPWSDTLRLQLRHRSVRDFLPGPVGDESLDVILRAAQSASHSSNLQAWSVVVVRDEDRRRRISEAIGSMAFIRQAPVFLVWVADLHRGAQVLGRRGQEMETVSYLEGAIVPFVDIGIAAQNALLAAESLGLGGVFVGALRNNPAAIVDELHLPRHTFPALGMALGVPNPDEAAGIKPRLASSAVVHRETYDGASWREPVEAYERRLMRYFERFGVHGYSWADRVSRRLGPRSGLNGRHRLRAWLEDQGFSGR